LEILNRKGEKLAVLTSCMPHLCAAALKRHGIHDRFHSIHYSHLIDIEKSEPELFRTVAQLEGLDPAECILFDDSPDYLAAAREAGWQVFGVRDPLFDYRAQEITSICGADRYLPNLSSYITFL